MDEKELLEKMRLVFARYLEDKVEPLVHLYVGRHLIEIIQTAKEQATKDIAQKLLEMAIHDSAIKKG